jgi:hypothetical protein
VATPNGLVARHRPERSTIIAAGAGTVLAVLVGLATVRLGSFQHQLKAALIVVALLTMAFAALRPVGGLVVLLALSPFDFPFYGTSSDQVLLVALALMLVWRIRLRAVPAWIWVGGLALVAGLFIATIGAHNRSVALEGAINWTAAAILLMAAVTLLRERREATAFAIRVFLGGAVVVAFFGVLQKAGVTAIVGPSWDGSHPNSFFGYYTVYAGYIAMAATLATAEALIAMDDGRRVRAGMFLAVLVVMLLGLAETTSRGGIVALAAGWLTLLVLNLKRGTMLARAVVVLLVASAAAYVVIPHATILTLEHRFATSTGALGEDRTRFAVQRAGETALQHHPFGLGSGNFPYFVNQAVHSGLIHQPFFHAQETFIQVGLDAGWLGLLGFVSLIGGVLVITLRRRQLGSSSIRAAAFAAALVGFLAQGLYDYLFWQIPFLIFFMFLIWGAFQATHAEIERTAGDRQTAPGEHQSALFRPDP